MRRLLCLLAVVLLVAPAAARAATFTVDSPADSASGACDGTATCTLRAAIRAANVTPERDAIRFDLPAGATIRPKDAPLPAITAPVDIDGRPGGATPAAVPGVELDGSLMPSPPPESIPSGSFRVRGASGLSVQGARDVTIRGLAIHSFPAASVMVRDAVATTIQTSHLGTDLAGVEDHGRVVAGGIDAVGVNVENSVATRIGGLTEERNVISGLERGVVVSGGSVRTSVVGNWIGVTANGLAPLGNDHTGVLLTKEQFGARSRESYVAANVVAATGSSVDQPTAGEGIVALRTQDDRILENYVGFNPFGEVVGTFGQGMGNTGHGIQLTSTEGTEVGVHDGEVNLGNHVAASGGVGIYLTGELVDVRVRANVVGLDAAGARAEVDGHSTANAGSGIAVQAAVGATATGTRIGGPAATDGNVVAGNAIAGIRLQGAVAGAEVLNNRVGTDAAGLRALGNGSAGITVEGRSDGAVRLVPTDVQIGRPGQGNVVAGEQDGVRLLDGARTSVQGNRLGVGADGRPLGLGDGVVVEGGEDVLVGGSGAQEGNVIGDARNGIEVSGGPRRVRVVGNTVGVRPDGTPDARFGADVGIRVTATGDQAPAQVEVGGALPGEGNVVLAADVGVEVRRAAVRVRGNQFGRSDAPNGVGVELQSATGTTIGGATAGDGNDIGATTGWGVHVRGQAAARVSGNRIGSEAAGAPRRGGILLQDASSVVVGLTAPESDASRGACAGHCNLIRGVGGAGVAVIGQSVADTILGNRVVGAAGLAVDLGNDGPSRLDERDADTGPNDGLNHPALVQEIATPRASRPFAVTGQVEAVDPTRLRVRVYGQPRLDAGGTAAAFGQDAVRLGEVRPDRRGRFSLPIVATDRQPFYTAQVIDPDGASSEFARGCGAGAPAAGLDSDADGLCDAWERNGIDFDGDGAADFSPGAAGARVGTRDLLLEVDATADAPAPALEVLRRLRTALGSGPAGGLALHVLRQGGRQVGRAPALTAPTLSGTTRRGTAWDDLADFRYGPDGTSCQGAFGPAPAGRADATCFARAAAQGAVVRYALFTNEITPEAAGGSATLGIAPGGAAMVIGVAGVGEGTIRGQADGDPACGSPDGCRMILETYTAMHELGHLIGLRHRGLGDTPHIDPLNLSIMSYLYASPNMGNPLDYSRGDGQRLSEQEVDETTGLPLADGPRARGWKPIAAAVRSHRGRPKCVAIAATGGGRDFDGDGHLNPRVAHGLNDFADQGAGELPCLQARRQQDVLDGTVDEWATLTPAISGVTDSFGEGARTVHRRAGEAGVTPILADLDGDGVIGDDVCPRRADPGQADGDGDGVGDACVADLLESDVSVALDGPRRAAPGEEVALVLRAANDWPRAVGGVAVAVALPPGLELLRTEGDGRWDPGTATWEAGELPARGRRRLTLVVRAADTGQPVVRTDVVRAGPAGSRDVDSVPGNDEAEEDDHAELRISVLEPAAAPVVSIADAQTTEGDRRPRTLRFAITLDRPAPVSVRLRARVDGGTAQVGRDVEALDADVEIPAGETAASVTVPVRPDQEPEPAETVEVVLDRLDGADPCRLRATGTIADDDLPADPGDLLPFGCASARRPDVGCTLQDVRMTDVTAVAGFGDSDAYALGEDRVLQLRRDASTESWSIAGCLGVGEDSGACETPTFAGPRGPEPVLGHTSQQLVTVTPDGRWVIVATTWPGTGADGGLLVLRRDAATGALAFASCTSGLEGRACVDGPGFWYPDALLVSPDGRDVYLAKGPRIEQVRIDAESGAVVPVACFAPPAEEPEGGDGCRPLTTGATDGASIAMAPDGRALLIRSPGRLVRVSRDLLTGALTEPASLDVPGDGALAVAPDGRSAYVAARGAGTIRQVDLSEPAPRLGACVQDAAGGDPGCRRTTVSLRDVLGLVVGPQGVYAALDGGALLSVTPDGGATLGRVRCVDPETGTAPCGAEARPRRAAGWRTPLVTPDGRLVLSAAGGTLQRLAIVQPAAAANRPPTCPPVHASAQTNRPARVQLGCVDFDGDPLTHRLTRPPAHATIGAFDVASGELELHPERGFRGSDDFDVAADDGRGGQAAATVTFAVGDRPPACTSAQLRLQSGSSGRVPVRCVDPEGGSVTLELIAQPEHGSASLDGADLVLRTDPERTGRTAARVRATDEDGSSSVHDVAILVLAPPPPNAPAGGGGQGPSGGTRGPGGRDRTCRRSCVPDDDGRLTVRYYCGPRETSQGGYASCQVDAWLLVCQRGRCEVTRARAAVLDAPKPPPGTPISHARVDVDAGADGAVDLRLNAAARRLLVRRGTLRVQLVLDVRDTGGRRRRTRELLELRAPATLALPSRAVPGRLAGGLATSLRCAAACSAELTVRAGGRQRTTRVRLPGAGARRLRLPALRVRSGQRVSVTARVAVKGHRRLVVRRVVLARSR